MAVVVVVVMMMMMLMMMMMVVMMLVMMMVIRSQPHLQSLLELGQLLAMGPLRGGQAG
jgi:hypothetical protein